MNGTEEKHHHDPLIFPTGFLWGASTSSYQIEGGNKNCDWWQWEKKRFKGHPENQSAEASGHYKRFKSDWKLAKDLGHNAARLSIEWARIEPKKGEWSEKEIAHYKESLKELKKNGMTTSVTLHHFTNPIWISEMGGWTKKQTALYFVRYAKKMEEELGQYVDFWITINEPMIYIGNSYFQGVWPPQIKFGWFSGWRVFKNMIYAHKKSYKEIKKVAQRLGRRTPKIGIANNLIDFRTYEVFSSVVDYVAIRILNWAWNYRFLNAIKHKLDFIGVNYYFHIRLKRSGLRFSTEIIDTRGENRELSDMNWEVYPQGIFEILISLRKYKLPIYITENGIAANNDRKRIRFIIAHLKEIYHAIQAGVDVRGYFYWSLIDNFEWDKGFKPRFGLVEINYSNMKRIPRPSAYVYKTIAENNRIEHELLRFLGHGVRIEDIFENKSGNHVLRKQ